MLAVLKRVARQLPTLLGVLLLGGAIYVVWKEFHHLKISDIRAALSDISTRALVGSFIWTVLSYGVLTFYDRLGTMFAGHKVSYRRVAFASFCAYALSHNLGFAAVSGAAVRYRLYAHWGLSPVQIAKVIAFCSLTFGLGGMVLGGVILFVEPEAVPFLGTVIPHWGMYLIATLLWGIVIGYVSLSRFVGAFRLFGVQIELPHWKMAFVQVALATVDVAVTAAIMYQLLPDAPTLTFSRFLGVYLSSYTAGLAANIPGGLGVFDTAMLLGLEPYMSAPRILGGIVVFRLYYYIIPLFIAGTLFSGNEIMVRGGAMFRRGGRARATGRTPANSVFSERSFAVVTSTGLVALCGAMLLGIGVLDDRPQFPWFDADFAEVAAHAGQFIPSLIGAALMVLAIGLTRRVTFAWLMTIILLVIGAAYTTAQGAATWVPAALLLTAIMIAPFREAYYRHARLIATPLQPATLVPLLVLAVCALNLALLEPRVRGLSENSLFDLVMSPDFSNGSRVTLALVVLLALAALWRLIRPVRVRWLEWKGEGRLRYAALGIDPPANADGVVFGENERAAVPFRRVGRVLLGLGDPAGAESDRVSAIWNLRDLALQEHRDPAVYRAGPALAKVYEDLGLTPVALDSDGLVSTETSAASDEFLYCLAERDMGLLVPLLPEIAGRPLRDAAE
ncbi:MAG: phosphatidylglycerol lysyltransferase domain-containing protein [Acetobacteraceae bacterium]|nr:phosphatidylglycerol lysyltransferase domain-containing protein [Acetobacteraceae bacterium]